MGVLKGYGRGLDKRGRTESGWEDQFSMGGLNGGGRMEW